MATGTSTSAVKSNEHSKASASADSCNQIALDWLNVYMQVYRESLTPELVVAYQTALADLRPEFLHKAFLRAMRSSTFRPTPAEVRQCYAVEIENAPRPKQIELPPMSDAEREEIGKRFDELWAKLKLPSWPRVDVKKRRSELKKQAEEILAKYPVKGKR